MKILLIDGYNMLYRMRSGWAKGDFPIVFTFFRSMRALVEKFSPDIVYFVLEGVPVRRLELMSEYKAQREYHDLDDFSRQKSIIINMLKNDFPVHVVRHPNYECDDVLAGLATLKHKNDECVIISSDSDFYQLLHVHTSLKLYNPVRKKFIETPECDYVTWKALKGDSSDNIQGFKGVGDKTAIKLTLDPNLLDHFLSKDNRRSKFLLNLEMIKFHDMTTDLDNIESSEVQANWKSVKQCFIDMKFSSLITDKYWTKFINTFDRLS